ncbi:LPXTG cell wall anchor domain-containing protein [Streptococcus porci]|uniref:LPXTG cell wall anchor domain-containing protein n=1 Tax=Streptococcus porci TaxID=502567 RepID=UPI0003FFF4A5|nr:LPXTG cell wall anchor domain-containing protein [Streptococcus porci]
MKKITKFSLSLASLAILGGGVVTNVVPVLDKNIVHAEDTAQQAISVLIGTVSAEDGPLSHYFVTINPGETKTVSAPEVAGYKLDEYTEPTYTFTYDYALRMYKEGGSAWIQFWMVKDSPAPEPTNPEQPVQQPKTLKVAWISIDGDLSNTTLKEEVITVNPGESHTVSALDFPGYRLTDGSKAGTYTYETMERETHVGIWYTRDHSTPTPKPTPDSTVTEEPTTEASTTTAPTTTEAPWTETSSAESSATSSSSSASTTSGKADSTSTASTTARTEVTEAKTEAPTTQKEEKKTLPKTGEEAQALLSLTGIGVLVASLLAWKERRNH